MTLRTKSKLSFLETVYPPVSNQEAVWLKKDLEVEAHLRQSDFYMIGDRAEAKYLNLAINHNTSIVIFDFAIGDDFRDPVEIHVVDLPAVEASKAISHYIECGEKIIRVWDGPICELGSNVLAWFTTEKLIWDRYRGRAGIGRFDFTVKPQPTIFFMWASQRLETALTALSRMGIRLAWTF